MGSTPAATNRNRRVSGPLEGPDRCDEGTLRRSLSLRLSLSLWLVLSLVLSLLRGYGGARFCSLPVAPAMRFAIETL
jgi:hypothetical protein